MDISQMTEEEQLQAAMELSLQDMGSSRATGGGTSGGQTAATAQAAGHPPPPDRGRPRTYPRKDPQDVLAPPLRGSAKKKKLEESRADQAGTAVQLSNTEVAELLRLIFGDSPEAQDVERWFDVGFQFSLLAGTQWGLWQRHGGPCGIFAPVQAFITKHLLFEHTAAEGSQEPEAATRRQEQPLSFIGADDEDVRAGVLAYALSTVLFNAAPTSSYVVCQAAPQGAAAAPEGQAPSHGAAAQVAAASAGNGGVTVVGRRLSRVADAQQLLEEGVYSWLAGPYGVLSFICSVLLSRALSTVREDMDDSSNPLIGRFGHCSQELVNLMLLGEATSNVFDGTRWLGDDPSSGLLLKGVDGDKIGVPPVGFLSELEPMRYLCVGTLYKYPEFPIWVLGSPTHYTVLFSTRRSDSQLSPEAELEQRARKVFVDNAFDEGGLAMATNLGTMLDALGVARDQLSKAQSALVHEEIILWDDFRSWTLRHFGLADAAASGEATKRLKLFLYDGQDPPGPSIRSVTLELSDIDPMLAGGGSEGSAFAATLHTRWPNAIVQMDALFGAEGS